MAGFVECMPTVDSSSDSCFSAPLSHTADVRQSCHHVCDSTPTSTCNSATHTHTSCCAGGMHTHAPCCDGACDMLHQPQGDSASPLHDFPAKQARREITCITKLQRPPTLLSHQAGGFSAPLHMCDLNNHDPVLACRCASQPHSSRSCASPNTTFARSLMDPKSAAPQWILTQGKPHPPCCVCD